MKGKELEIHYCPTEDMLGGFFTKLLTGPLFKKFRDSILGITEEEYYKAKANNATTQINSGEEVAQECVMVSLIGYHIGASTYARVRIKRVWKCTLTSRTRTHSRIAYVHLYKYQGDVIRCVSDLWIFTSCHTVIYD